MRRAQTPHPRLAWAVALGLLVAPGIGATEGETPAGAIHTDRPNPRVLPLPDEEDSFHFIIFGDRTGGPAEGIRVLEEAVSDTNLLAPDLVMTVGDLVQGYNATPEWLDQMREFRGVMDKLDMPWFPVAGNHDIYWRGEGKPPAGEHERDYEFHFGPLWYWFRHKNAGFIILFSDEGDPKTGAKGFSAPEVIQMSPAQLEWLSKALAGLRDADQVFVFLHHPRWWTERYRGSNWNEVHELLLRAGNVSAVFAGHIHRMRYDGKKDGIEYFSLATTGGSIPGEFPQAGYVHHFNVVTVRKHTFQVGTIPVGTVIDPRDFTPERLEAIDLVGRMEIRPAGRLLVGLRGEAGGFTGLRFANPAKLPIEVTVRPEYDVLEWLFSPDHRHVRIEPGEEVEIELAYARRALGFDDLKNPRLAIDIDAIEEGARLGLPPRSVVLPLGLRELPPARAAADLAIALDSPASRVRVDPDLLALPDGPFTLELWVDPATASPSGALAAKTENSELGLSVHEGRPRVMVHLDGRYVTVDADRTLAPNVWQHVAGVFDGSELRLYVAGRLAGRKEARGHRTTNRLPLYIGADTDGSGRAVSFLSPARIDDVRISRVARYSGDVADLDAAQAIDGDTLILYSANRAVGPFLIDESDHGAHGFLEGGAHLVAKETEPPAG